MSKETMGMRKAWLIAAVALMALAACGNRDSVPQPKVLLSEQQMIDVLTDSYLIEAEMNQRKSVGQDVAKLQGDYYQQLFEHYGITDSIFNANMKYYGYHLETLERIIDSVNERFQRAQSKE